LTAYAGSVPIGEAVAMAFMAGAFLASGRAYRDRFWPILGFGVLGLVAFEFVRVGLRGVLIAGPISGSLMFASLLIGSLFWAQLVGLPRWLALRTGVGLTSRALAFNNRLIEHRASLADAIRVVQEDPRRRPDALKLASELVRRVRALRPPDAAWAQLRDDIADEEDAWLNLLRDDVPSERLADLAHAFAPLAARWAQMDAQAAHDQRLIASPARRRRAMVVWLAVLGSSCLLIGLAQARGHNLLSLDLTDPSVWLALVELVGGGLAIGNALIVALRR
jgi:hypothetical protein